MKVVRLADEVDLNSIIENKKYADSLVVGPAVIALLGDVTLSGNRFIGDPNAIFIEVPEGKSVTGVIGLRNVTFERCEFRNVGIIGSPAALAEIRDGFGPHLAAAPE